MIYHTFMSSKNALHSNETAALEKVAWLELLVSTTTIIVVMILLPFLGHGASSGFALLGAVVFAYWFVRKRRTKMIVDERDLEIELHSVKRGVEAAWMFLLLGLIIIVLLPQSGDQNEFVTKTTLNWLIWIQFAIYIGVKGFVGVISYRKQAYAS